VDIVIRVCPVSLRNVLLPAISVPVARHVTPYPALPGQALVAVSNPSKLTVDPTVVCAPMPTAAHITLFCTHISYSACLQDPSQQLEACSSAVDPESLAGAEEKVIQWSSVDPPQHVSGLTLCAVHAEEANAVCLCVRSQLPRRWQGAGVKMKEARHEHATRAIRPTHMTSSTMFPP
jgi:hypothetical protein